MKGLGLVIFGALLGFPLGYLFRMIFVSPPKKQCKFIRESTNESKRPIFTRCAGAEATSCVEHLCPSHCKEVHGDRCKEQLFVDNVARIH